MPRSFWLCLFTPDTWDEFLIAGGETTGFPERRWRTVQAIREGDYLLAYLAGAQRWIAAFEVVSDPYLDRTKIWTRGEFPCRLKVRSIVQLTPETAIPALSLADKLSAFQRLQNPAHWGVIFQTSPAKWSDADANIVLEALHEAQGNPVSRPLKRMRPAKFPPKKTDQLDSIAIPADEPERDESPGSLERAESDHTEIQWLLLKLGNDMGLDVWAARNDRNRSFKGQRFTDLPRLRSALPLQFDEDTRRTVELIDVLWLRANGIAAAFEVESTTSIYSGLLRMSDLISMQPNLNIPLFIVAPAERKARVVTEINRPTFSRLTPPLKQICRYISFTSLRQQVDRLEAVIRYLRPEFLDDLSESCEMDR